MTSVKAFLSDLIPSLFGVKGEAEALPLERPDLVGPLTAHLESLAALANLEFQDYKARLIRKALGFFIGALLLFVGYLILNVTCIVFLAHYWTLQYASLAVGGVQFVAGLVFVLIAFKKKLGNPTPDTCEQLKTDYECLKLSLGKNKSCS